VCGLSILFTPRRTILIAILVAFLLAAASTAAAERHWSIELLGGSAHNFSTPLTVRQDQEPELRLTARYATRPWSGAPYYALRLSRWTAETGWEVELVHHKLYLINRPLEIQHFEITHGYNLLLLNRALRIGEWVARGGAGTVIDHTESTVRGRDRDDGDSWGSGYGVGGIAAQIAVGRGADLGHGVSLVVEGKLTVAQTEVRIAEGSAIVRNLAAHALIGARYTRLQHR
jgi:hypothetical protein